MQTKRKREACRRELSHGSIDIDAVQYAKISSEIKKLGQSDPNVASAHNSILQAVKFYEHCRPIKVRDATILDVDKHGKIGFFDYLNITFASGKKRRTISCLRRGDTTHLEAILKSFTGLPNSSNFQVLNLLRMPWLLVPQKIQDRVMCATNILIAEHFSKPETAISKMANHQKVVAAEKAKLRRKAVGMLRVLELNGFSEEDVSQIWREAFVTRLMER